MGRQQDRVAARRAIHEARVARVQAARDREAAIEELAVRVQVEVRAASRAAREAELRVGRLLEQMAATHRLTATQVSTWCAGVVTPREVGRLRRLARTEPAAPGAAPVPAGSGQLVGSNGVRPDTGEENHDQH